MLWTVSQKKSSHLKKLPSIFVTFNGMEKNKLIIYSTHAGESCKERAALTPWLKDVLKSEGGEKACQQRYEVQLISTCSAW